MIADPRVEAARANVTADRCSVCVEPMLSCLCRGAEMRALLRGVIAAYDERLRVNVGLLAENTALKQAAARPAAEPPA